MKVRIGNYPSFVRATRISDKWIEFRHKKPYWNVDENEHSWSERVLEKVCDDIIQPFLNATINRYFNWKGRKIKVRIDRYDTWSMDDTLSYIIHPMLVQLRNTKHGSPLVDDEDVPENLRSTAAEPKKNEWDVDSLHHQRWEWILDEMIFAFHAKTIDWEDQFYKFDQSNSESLSLVDADRKGRDAYAKRMENGFRLFGKYYQALWD